MEFRTIIPIQENDVKIRHDDKIMMLGSCFSDNIGNRLKQDMFNVDINPFGTLYNPLSIAQALRRMLENKPFSAAELFQHNNLWHSFQHHSAFSSQDNNKVIENINQRFRQGVAFLETAKVLIVTFGTAYVYRLAENNEIVANCHKLPAKQFNRNIISVQEITDIWETLIEEIHQRFPQIQIIFTVSPIRHLSDGAHENQISKSTLLFAENELIKKFNNCKYFPAYEIMLDDLRDYRFYANDMVHPSDMAVDYIYQKFSDCNFTEQTKTAAKECAKLFKRLTHRQLTDDNEAIQAFQKSTAELKERLIAKYPYLKDITE